jgi:hypothetical protein
MKFQKWVCPKCLLLVEQKAEEVVHRCPSNKNKMTDFKLQEGSNVK